MVPAEKGTGVTKLNYAPGRTHSVAGLFDESNKVVNRYRYATGPEEAAHMTDNWSNPLRYAGQRRDAETALYYNRARYYDPAIRR